MRDNGPTTDHEIELADGTVLVSRTDQGGRITFVNDGLVAISGYSRDQLLGAPHNILRHPDMPKEAFADLWQTIKDGHHWTGVIKNRAQNGDHYWVRADVTPFRENGDLAGYISIRSKATREEIHAAEALYAGIRNKSLRHIQLQRGEVHDHSWIGRLKERFLSIQIRMLGIFLLLIVFLLLVGGIGIRGVRLSNLGIETVYQERAVPIVQLAKVSDLLRDSLYQVTLLQAELAHGDPIDKRLKRLRKDSEQIPQQLTRLRAVLTSSDETDALKAVDDLAKALIDSVLTPAEAAAVAHDSAALLTLSTQTLPKLSDKLTGATGELFAMEIGMAGDSYEAAQKAFRPILYAMSILLGLSVIFSVLLGRWLLTSIRKPLIRLQDNFEGLSRGDFTSDIQVERTTEFRRTNAMLRAMRAKLGYNLQEKSENDRKSREFLERQMQTLTQMIDGEVQSSVANICAEAAKLSEAATVLSRISTDLGGMAENVANLSDTTRDNVERVATAAARLDDSSRHIGEQIGLTTRQADIARERAELATQRVSSLSASTAKIGNIVDIIRSIARQTRMLAMNATIESARAGIAGKGFAVVAGEVKGLADLTDQEIGAVSSQAAEISETTADSVTTVQDASQAIQAIDSIAADVATAADAQQAASADIMQIANVAVEHTRTVSENVSAMLRDVQLAGSTAHEVHGFAEKVNHDISALQRRLYVILRSSQAGNRRRSKRQVLSIPYQAELDGIRFDGITSDLSAHGAMLILGKPMPAQQGLGTVSFDKIGKISFTLVAQTDDSMSLQFRDVVPEQSQRIDEIIQAAAQADAPMQAECEVIAKQFATYWEGAVGRHEILEVALWEPEYGIPDPRNGQIEAGYTALAERLFLPQLQESLALDSKVVACCMIDRNGYQIAAEKHAGGKTGQSILRGGQDLAWHRKMAADPDSLVAARSPQSLVQTNISRNERGHLLLFKEFVAPIVLKDQHWGAVRLVLELRGL